MKRNIQKGVLVFLTLALVTSCSTTNDVVSNRGIQKRKYTKGYFFDFNNKIGGNSHDNIAKEGDNPNVETSETVETSEEIKVRNYETEVVKVEEIGVVDIPESNVPEVLDEINAPVENQTRKPEEDKSIETDKVESNSPREDFSPNKFNKKIRKVSQRRMVTTVPAESGLLVVLLILIALILPPLAVLIYDGLSSRFLIDLILFLLGLGAFIYLGGLSYLFMLAAIIYAILVVIGAF